MPSTKTPASVVNPGSGKIAANTVTASALSFLSGGGSGASLLAHITDPVDAHMASAIGVNPVYPASGEPLLSTAGGVLDGESVLDFINQFKDLLPARPNQLGRFNPNIPNSGIPDWGDLSGLVNNGGWASGTDVVPTHYLLGVSSTTSTLSGIIYPADRGVLALYRNTSGDFFDAPNTTLIGALWLGESPAPFGLPDAAFNPANRKVGQVAYTASLVSLDIFNLTFRLPQVKDYVLFGAPYANYDIDFPSYQLASFSAILNIISGSAGSYLLVHWRENFATNLAAIQPVNLTLPNLTASNAYSATPTVPSDFDDLTKDVSNINRLNTFRDINSAATPTLTGWVNTLNGLPSKVFLSGIGFYDNGGVPVSWTMTIQAAGLFDNSFSLGQTPSVQVPAGYTSPPPMSLDFTFLGGGSFEIPYDYLSATSGGATFTLSSSPQIGDDGWFEPTGQGIYSPTNFCTPAIPAAKLKLVLRSGTQNFATYTDTGDAYLVNTYPQTGPSTESTNILAAFVDENYRYLSSYVPSNPLATIVPAVLDAFDSLTPLAIDDGNLQVIGGELIYPQHDFSTGYSPVGADYSSFDSSDTPNHIRWYVRAFNTGISRNTGKIRIFGLLTGDFLATGPFGDITGHPGGVLLQIRVPGSTDWLDLGRDKGDPDMGTTYGRGCKIGLESPSLSEHVITFDCTEYTPDNGAGEFPLFFRVGFIQGLTLAIKCTSISFEV